MVGLHLVLVMLCKRFAISIEQDQIDSVTLNIAYSVVSVQSLLSVVPTNYTI